MSIDELLLRDSNRMLCNKLLDYRRESKALKKTLGFPINFKIMIKIIIQVNLMQKVIE